MPMKLNQTPDLYAFLSTYISDADLYADTQATQKFISAASSEKQQLVATQIKAMLAEGDLPVDEFGAEANRWFGDTEEASEWLRQILSTLEEAGNEADTVVVKDSNGTPLNEGDSVSVIKDLKVKGGTSDLKRGTLIKKIHLIGDPENIECKVDGSTLVLKTLFLKKS